MIQARVWSCRKLMGNHCTRTPCCRKVRPLPSELASLMEIMSNLISKILLEPFNVHKPCAASDENGDRNSQVLKQAWSCICCCSSRNKTQAWCQKGSCSVKGKVHPVSRIEKWEEKITEAKRNGKILVVNFKASWCLPCKKIEPIYQELASTYTSMIFVTIDVEELAEFSNEWNVEATPTVVFLKDGRQMDKLVGGDAAELQKKTAAAADLLLRQS